MGGGSFPPSSGSSMTSAQDAPCLLPRYSRRWSTITSPSPGPGTSTSTSTSRNSEGALPHGPRATEAAAPARAPARAPASARVELSLDELVTQHALVGDLASAPACNGQLAPPHPQSVASAETKAKATKAKATKAKAAVAKAAEAKAAEAKAAEARHSAQHSMLQAPEACKDASARQTAAAMWMFMRLLWDYETELYDWVRRSVAQSCKPESYPMEDWYIGPLPDRIRCPLCRAKITVPRQLSMFARQWYQPVQEHIVAAHKGGIRLLQSLNADVTLNRDGYQNRASMNKLFARAGKKQAQQAQRDKLFEKLLCQQPTNDCEFQGHTCPVGSCKQRFAYVSHALYHLHYAHTPREVCQSLGITCGSGQAVTTTPGSGWLKGVVAKPQNRKRQAANEAAKALYGHAKGGRADLVATILRDGAVAVNPNGGGEDGFTPLMTASEAGHAEVVHLLLGDRRVHPNAKNTYGQTALLFAAQKGRADVVGALLRCPRLAVDAICANRTALMTASECNHTDVVALLAADERCGLDITDDHGLTALSLAAKHGNGAVVDTLLQSAHRAADLAKPCFRGLAADQHAASNGHAALAARLAALAAMQRRHEKQQAQAQGDREQGPRRCQECKADKPSGDVDPADGRWYCTGCWEAFAGAEAVAGVGGAVAGGAEATAAVTLGDLRARLHGHQRQLAAMATSGPNQNGSKNQRKRLKKEIAVLKDRLLAAH